MACTASEPIVPGLAESQIGGAISAVAVEGDIAWLGAGQRLQGVDLSDRSHPRPLGQSEPLGAPIRALAVRDGMAYAAIGIEGLALIDVSDPDRPRDSTSLPTGWAINDLEIVGDRIYLAEGALGLRIVERSTGLATIGTVDTPGDSLAVLVDGELAYVADWGTGLRIIDVTDASAPEEIASLDTPGEAAGLAKAGDLLLIADRGGGLRVVDVSLPRRPREIGALELEGPAERVAVADGLVYVASQEGGLVTVDVQDPAQPRPTGRLDGVTVAVDLAVDGAHVYVADNGAALPPVRDSRDALWARMHVWGAETRPEVALGMSVLHVAERSRSGGPSPVGVYGSPSLVESATVDEDRGLMYAADGHAGVLVLDLADPSAPRLLGRVETPGVAHDLVFTERRIYVADGPAGLGMLDRGDPIAPTFSGSIRIPGEAYGMALGDRELVYVAAGTAGLVVIDARSGEQVRPAIDSPGFAWDVTRQDDRLYLADRSWGLRIFDISDPSLPRELGVALAGRGDVLDIAFAGGLAWVAAGPSGLFALDVDDPAAVEVVGQSAVADRAIGLIVDGDTAYVAAGNGGLRALDISSPRAPRERAAWSFPGAAERLAVFGDLVYVSAESGGVQVLRVR